MPIYQYRCRTCDQHFDLAERVDPATLDCQACASDDVARIFGGMNVVVPKAFRSSPGGMTVREQQQEIYAGARAAGRDIQRVK